MLFYFWIIRNFILKSKTWKLMKYTFRIFNLIIILCQINLFFIRKVKIISNLKKGSLLNLNKIKSNVSNFNNIIYILHLLFNIKYINLLN